MWKLTPENPEKSHEELLAEAFPERKPPGIAASRTSNSSIEHTGGIQDGSDNHFPASANHGGGNLPSDSGAQLLQQRLIS